MEERPETPRHSEKGTSPSTGSHPRASSPSSQQKTHGGSSSNAFSNSPSSQQPGEWSSSPNSFTQSGEGSLGSSSPPQSGRASFSPQSGSASPSSSPPSQPGAASSNPSLSPPPQPGGVTSPGPSSPQRPGGDIQSHPFSQQQSGGLQSGPHPQSQPGSPSQQSQAWGNEFSRDAMSFHADPPYDAINLRNPQQILVDPQTGVPKPPERQIGGIPASQNHSAHELFAVHEVLHTTLNVLDQYLLLRPRSCCQELSAMLDRQYAFLCDEYNMMVQCFSTGQDPEHRTGRYMMRVNNQTSFHQQPMGMAIRRPIASENAVSGPHIAIYSLGMLKSLVAQKAAAVCEIIHPVIRRVISDSLPNNIEMAYELYLYLNHRGQYAVPQMGPQTMQGMTNAFVQAPHSPRANASVNFLQ
ncbi:spore coat protein [Pasteuria penetrans]|uniref:spore coat protein n=1 Tax=Pasteuria penetrans TaxID=86005 RepID=UPI0011ED7774|nr:spore coat protein [Pasteuria penetrans]